MMNVVSSDGKFTPALPVSSCGLVTLGIGFMWTGVLLNDDRKNCCDVSRHGNHEDGKYRAAARPDFELLLLNARWKPGHETSKIVASTAQSPSAIISLELLSSRAFLFGLHELPPSIPLFGLAGLLQDLQDILILNHASSISLELSADLLLCTQWMYSGQSKGCFSGDLGSQFGNHPSVCSTEMLRWCV